MKRALQRLFEALTRPRNRDDFYWPAVIAAFAAALYFLGWFASFARSGLAGKIVMLTIAAVLFFALAILLPVAYKLASALFTGDPYWIAPRPFEAASDPLKTKALQRRLELLAADRAAALWQDRETGQFWASRRFFTPDGEITLYKPLARRELWTGLEDANWDLPE